MLCIVTGTPVRGIPRDQTREYTKLFQQWKAPTGYDMKSLYFGTDGSVFVVADIQSSAASYEAAFPWTGWEWSIVPVVEAPEMLKIQERVRAWEDKTLAG